MAVISLDVKIDVPFFVWFTFQTMFVFHWIQKNVVILMKKIRNTTVTVELFPVKYIETILSFEFQKQVQWKQTELEKRNESSHSLICDFVMRLTENLFLLCIL